MLIPQVIGEPGVDLNYEETVVYDNNAIRPAFLVVYGDIPHWQKIRSKLQSLAYTLNMQYAGDYPTRCPSHQDHDFR